MYKKIKSNWVKHFDFMVLDFCCTQISFILSYAIRHGVQMPYASTIYKNIAILIFVLQICIVFFTKTYSGILRRGYFDEFKASIKYNVILLGLLIVSMFMLQLSGTYSRIVIFCFCFLNCILMYAMHITYKFFMKRRMQNDKYLEYMYLITDKESVYEMTQGLLRNKYSSFILKGIIVVDYDMTGNIISGVPVIADADTLLECIRTNVVDEVFINIKNDNEKTGLIIEACLEMGIAVHINWDGLSVNPEDAELQRLNDFTVITTSINSVTQGQILLKRFMDIVGSVVGLMITGVILIFASPIIYIQSPGPILFTQQRVGKNGRSFKIYKFRSMYMDAEERKKELMKHNKINGLMFKMDNDPRVTPIGKFLRNTSLDEFPQFFNVLKGDMSLVGTRPPTVEEYKEYDYHHKKRLAIKPGLTGLWQISGRSDITDFEEVVRLDTKYITEWSLRLDLKILVKTVIAVLRKKGSY